MARRAAHAAIIIGGRRGARGGGERRRGGGRGGGRGGDRRDGGRRPRRRQTDRAEPRLQGVREPLPAGTGLRGHRLAVGLRQDRVDLPREREVFGGETARRVCPEGERDRVVVDRDVRVVSCALRERRDVVDEELRVFEAL